MEPKEMDALAAFVKKEADGLENDAAHGGEMGDRGAQRLRDLWSAYVAGARGFQPSAVPGLQAVVKAFNRATDPEFEIYQRLKQRFG